MAGFQRSPTGAAGAPRATPAPSASALGRVLLVDDEVAITRPVARHLQREGFDVATAHSLAQALALLRDTAFDVVVTDLALGGDSALDGDSGLTLARLVKQLDPPGHVIIITAHAEFDLAVQALRLGVDDYVVKPFDLTRLSDSVHHAVQNGRLRSENHLYRTRLEDRVRDQARRLEGLYIAGIRALITALEAKDPRTRGHSDRVTQYAMRLAETMSLTDSRSLAVGAALHDVGKIGTRDDVLRKPGPLTESEVGHIREHPVTGERILSAMLDDGSVLAVVRHHHERWDGRGYPDGLAGERIPMPARIVAVADSLDAITSPRAYRPVRSWGEAIDEIVACSARQFDPTVVAAAVASLRDPPGGAR